MYLLVLPARRLVTREPAASVFNCFTGSNRRHVTALILCACSAPISLDKLLEGPIPDDVKPLFEPVKLGKHKLKHRIVYAPLTR